MSTEISVAVLFILMYSNESSGLPSADFNISIEYGPSSKAVLPGSTTTMDCVARCNDPNQCKVDWYFKGYPLYPTKKLRIFLNGSLQITDFNKHNEGEYLCMVISKPFARLSRVAVLDLAVIQEKPQRMYEERAVVGDNVLLPCYVEGLPKPRITWTKHSNHLLFAERFVRTMASESNSLHIHHVTPEDAGLYKCHASNTAGKVFVASFAVNVSRKGEPKPIRQLSNIRTVGAMLDEPVTLECLWSFSESVWYRGAAKLVDSWRMGSNLFIAAASFSYAGVYTCRNSEDFLLYTDIKLTVYASPFLLTKREVHVNVRNGADVDLISVYIGRPTPEVKWFKNGYLLQERPNMKLFISKLNLSIHRTNLFIVNSTLSDFGIYQCVVFNRFGSFEVTFFVAIFEPRKTTRTIYQTKGTDERETEVLSGTDILKSPAAPKIKSTFLARQKEELEMFSIPLLAENNLNALLMAEALNDTAILVSISEAYQRFVERDVIKVCFGVYEAQEEAMCQRWLSRDDFTSNKIYVGGLRPMTKYYFGVRDEKKWLSEIITCSTELAIPIDLKYTRTIDNKLNITWSVPEMGEDNLHFIVSYTTDTWSDSNWSSNFVEGSTMFYVIENFTTDRDYMVKVISVLGSVVSAGSGILHVPASIIEGTQHEQLSLSPFKISVKITVFVVAVLNVAVTVSYAVWRRRQLRRTQEPVSNHEDQEKLSCFFKNSISN